MKIQEQKAKQKQQTKNGEKDTNWKYPPEKKQNTKNNPPLKTIKTKKHVQTNSPPKKKSMTKKYKLTPH